MVHSIEKGDPDTSNTPIFASRVNNIEFKKNIWIAENLQIS